MALNMDFTQWQAIDTAAMPWLSSPSSGVERRPLERAAAESGHATSVVRFQPNSHFDRHDHPGGEEIFVLDGVFSDEHGDYPAGSYLRNPIGSAHTPFSEQGCTLFVKLCQMQADDQRVVRKLTEDAGFCERSEGISQFPLHAHADERVHLTRFQPGASSPLHRHEGGEEIFILEGSIEDAGRHFPTGSWIRYPDGSHHQPHSAEGCLLLVKRGHLAV